MITWILILTLAPNPTGGSVINSVPGFQNEKACAYAAKVWADNRPAHRIGYSAVCVPTK